jgi:hypothetical protein
MIKRFLVLPTTFDKDPQLRMTSGVITIMIVALLTGGYSLTVLLWFACPSIIFRLEYILIPSTSCSIFGFLSTAWALATSGRYSVSLPSCPVTISLTLASTAIYGGLAVITMRRIKLITQTNSWESHRSWLDSGYYTPYASSTRPLASQSVASERGSVYYQQASPPALTEEEMVNQQMATLLTKADSRPNPDAAQSTFRLEWPTGGDEEELLNRNRDATFRNESQHGRSRSEGVTGAFSRIGRVIGIGDRSNNRLSAREDALNTERARSRERRRREIELGHP